LTTPTYVDLYRGVPPDDFAVGYDEGGLIYIYIYIYIFKELNF
jgi:hypothetical protein